MTVIPMDAFSIAKFWMVWNPDGRAPTRMHGTRETADAEAERLARSCPGNTFFVLKAVGGTQSQVSNRPIKITAAAPPQAADQEIPF